jgi:hypothetical protein
MATIVKVNYLSAERGGQKSAMGSVNYYAHRKDIDGQHVSRMGFSRDEDILDPQQMRDVIQQSDGSYYYRMVLSPGAEHDTAVSLKDWTRDVMLELEARHGEFPYVAIEHRDQTDYAHVHVVMVLEQKLSRTELDQLRETGTTLHEQRREWYEPTTDRSRESEQHLLHESVTYSEGFIAGYNDDPDEPIRTPRKNKYLSLDR